VPFEGFSIELSDSHRENIASAFELSTVRVSIEHLEVNDLAERKTRNTQLLTSAIDRQHTHGLPRRDA
jgi:hypothetical protein